MKNSHLPLDAGSCHVAPGEWSLSNLFGLNKLPSWSYLWHTPMASPYLRNYPREDGCFAPETTEFHTKPGFEALAIDKKTCKPSSTLNMHSKSCKATICIPLNPFIRRTTTATNFMFWKTLDIEIKQKAAELLLLAETNYTTIPKRLQNMYIKRKDTTQLRIALLRGRMFRAKRLALRYLENFWKTWRNPKP